MLLAKQSFAPFFNNGATLGYFQAEKDIDYLYSTKYTGTIKITNANSSCAALAGALVDIWHCTALGYYSEYSDTPGGGYATIDYTSSHFLRGRQTTDCKAGSF
jgi:protocatechuate 3,4-dioxygenase beta subunit